MLDLRDPAFIGCAGLRLLCRARNRVREHRGRLLLVTDSGRLMRILHGAGLAGVFEVYDRLPAPLAAAPSMELTAAAR